MAAIDDLTAVVTAEQATLAQLQTDIASAITDLQNSSPGNPAIADAVTKLQAINSALQQSATNLEGALPKP